MNSLSNVFGVLAAAGIGCAGGSVVLALMYCLMGEALLVGMTVVAIGPGLVAGVIGWAGVRWGIRRERRRFLARLEGGRTSGILEGIARG